MSQVLQAEKEALMDLMMSLIYVGTLLLGGFFGCLMVDITDRKSDEMAGLREPKIKIKKKISSLRR